MRVFLLPALFGILLAAAPVRAASYTLDRYDLDTPHTQILFSIDHMGFSRSYGKFPGYAGFFMFDKNHPEKSSVNVTIHTGTVDMSDKVWNDHVRDFFHVEKFPDMTFKSTAVKILPGNTADVTGDLTLLGVTKPVILHVLFRKDGRNMFGKYVAGFSAEADIKRSDFGMKDYIPAVGDDVHIMIEAEGNREDKPGQEQYNQ